MGAVLVGSTFYMIRQIIFNCLFCVNLRGEKIDGVFLKSPFVSGFCLIYNLGIYIEGGRRNVINF